jgi:amidase
MAYQPPSKAEIRRLGEDLGFDLSDAYIDSVSAYWRPFVDAFDLIEHLPDELPPVKYPRTPGYRPDAAENKYGAWYVKTSIKGVPSGKLAGRKVALKDTVCLAGVPMMNGASLLAGYVPEADATIVTRLLDAGAEIVGKAVCEYFCISSGGATSATGPVFNPRIPGYGTGGSSTGSGALVAAGEVDMATGGDQAGSIRIPSSWSGVVGIKPTHGLVPYTGIMGFDATIDHAGPMTAGVAANALYLEVMAGEDGLDSRQRNVKTAAYTEALGQSARGLRIAVVKEGFGQPDSEADVDETVRLAARKFEGLGATVAEVSIPWHLNGIVIWNPIGFEGGYHTMYGGRGWGNNREQVYLSSLIAPMSQIVERGNEMPDTMKFGMMLARHADTAYHGRYYAKAQNLRRRLRAEYDRILAEYDLLLMPTTRNKASKVPPPGAGFEAIMAHSWTAITNTCPFNVTGHPAISIPCGVGEGDRPIGLMLVAKHWQEATLYKAADAFERALDWRSVGPAKTGRS